MRHWWFSLLLMPPICVALLMALTYLLYPILLPAIMDSFFLIKGLMLFFAGLMILIQWKVSGAQLWIITGIWTVFTGLAFVTEHGGYDGNQNTGLAFHFFNYQFFAVLFSALYASLDLKKRQDRTNQEVTV